MVKSNKKEALWMKRALRAEVVDDKNCVPTDERGRHEAGGARAPRSLDHGKSRGRKHDDPFRSTTCATTGLRRIP